MKLGRDLAQACGEAADPQRLEGFLQRLDQRADFLDDGAKPFEALGGGGDQCAYLGIGFDMAEIEAEAKPEAAHALFESDRVVARL